MAGIEHSKSKETSPERTDASADNSPVRCEKRKAAAETTYEHEASPKKKNRKVEVVDARSGPGQAHKPKDKASENIDSTTIQENKEMASIDKPSDSGSTKEEGIEPSKSPQLDNEDPKPEETNDSSNDLAEPVTPQKLETVSEAGESSDEYSDTTTNDSEWERRISEPANQVRDELGWKLLYNSHLLTQRNVDKNVCDGSSGEPNHVLGSKINTGGTDWLEMMENDELYVDKTLFCDVICTGYIPNMFSWPPGFGKSLYLSMLYHFYDCSASDDLRERRRRQFMRCRVYKENREFFDENFATKPVLRLSFKNFGGETYKELGESANNEIYKQVVRVYQDMVSNLEKAKEWITKVNFEYVIEELHKLQHQLHLRNLENVPGSILQFTTDSLEWFYDVTAIILVDDLDGGFENRFKYGPNTIASELIRGEMESVLGSILKPDFSPYVKGFRRGILACRTPFSLATGSSGVNNGTCTNMEINENPFKYEYGRYIFDFEEKEVKQLIQRAVDVNPFNPQADVDKLFQIAKEMYSGYCNKGQKTFNPQSTIQFANHISTLRDFDDETLSRMASPFWQVSQCVGIVAPINEKPPKWFISTAKLLLYEFWNGTGGKQVFSQPSDFKKDWNSMKRGTVKSVCLEDTSRYPEKINDMVTWMYYHGYLTINEADYHIPNREVELQWRLILNNLAPGTFHKDKVYTLDKDEIRKMLRDAEILP
ncbi:hypothetical protein H4219_006362 [Mycoemilia scoparia]|uniref:AAA-ATPase-like domain-containing protein n=1 Tax=Mycoemilia scoparia TaxID=417184 RepID=A0A9W8DHQ2_9FUNG|nr:hypothetical protein H4219_006362 [Mycoemilia scoparia]